MSGGPGVGRTPPETIGDSKTEFNRILCTSKYEAAVTSNKKNCEVGMLKLTTDRHEASRGLFSYLNCTIVLHVTATPLELHHDILCSILLITVFFCSVSNDHMELAAMH